MLVDLRLSPDDPFMAQRDLEGRVTLTIPLDVLQRAFLAYLPNRSNFEQAAAAAPEGTRQ